MAKVTVKDKVKLYLYIGKLLLNQKKRDYSKINEEYNSGIWNQKYENIDFEKWSSNYDVDDDKPRILVKNGKLFLDNRTDYINEYYQQLFDILDSYKNESIVELGVGLGHIIFQLQKRNFKHLEGYDISENAIKSLNKYGTEKKYSIKFGVHDLNKSFPETMIDNKIVFTHTCLEQVKRFMPNVLKNIIAGKPKLVINFEVDYNTSPLIVKKYFDARDYQNNLVNELQRLEKQKEIKIISINKFPLSLSPVNRLSAIIWKIKD